MQNNINRVKVLKIVVILGVILSIIFAFIFFLSNSRLELNNNSKESVVVLVREGGVEQKIDMQAGEKRTLTTKKKFHVVEASAGNKHSIYQPKLGNYFQKSKIDIGLVEPKSSALLGKSELPCAKELDNQPIYYSCSPSSDGLIQLNDLAALPSPRLVEEKINAEGIAENNGTLSVKSYKNTFLEALQVENHLIITERNATGYIKQSEIKIDDYNSDITDKHYAVSGDAGAYAVLSSKANKIIYGDITNKEQKTIDISDENIDYEQSEAQIQINGSYIYLLVFLSQDHVENEDSSAESTVAVDPRIMVFDRYTGKKKETISQTSDSMVYGVSAGNGGLVYLSGKTRGEATLLTTNLEEKSLEGYGVNTRVPCWIDDKSFYYQSNEGNEIYRYEVAERVAYLVYRNNSSGNFINNISCANGTLYFAIDSQKDGEINMLNHYKLSDEPQVGSPIEEAFPKYIDIESQTYKASLVGSKKIEVTLVYNGLGASRLDIVRIKSILIDKLQFENINTNGLDINYSD